MQRVLVLGAGQLGTFAARAIEKLAHWVMVADLNPPDGFFKRFGPVRNGNFVRADMLDRTAIISLVKEQRINTIVLSAGGGRGPVPDGLREREINIKGSQRVAEAALETGVKRLVFISSFAVYGGMKTADTICETTTPMPCTEYGRMKAEAEAALAVFRQRGLELRILRPCGIYGPRRVNAGSKSARFIDSLLAQAIGGKPFTMRVPRASEDEYLYVKDIRRAIALAALCDTDSPEFIFNVGAGRKTTVEDLCLVVKQVAPKLRVKLEVGEETNGHHIPPLDTSLMRKVFGFRRRYSLHKGLTDYLKEVKL